MPYIITSDRIAVEQTTEDSGQAIRIGKAEKELRPGARVEIHYANDPAEVADSTVLAVVHNDGSAYSKGSF